VTTNRFIKRLLKLKGMKVTGHHFENYNKELHIDVAPKSNGCRCAECGRRGTIHRLSRNNRIWKDITVAGIVIYLHYTPKEIVCDTHGIIQEQIPWASEFSTITYRLEYILLRYSQIMTQTAAAELLRIPKSTLSSILHRTISRIRSGHRIRNLVSAGVDEISYKKGKKFATVVYDLDRGCVVWIGKGKAKAVITEFFTTCLSEAQRKRIQWASCDMSSTYINAIKENCPNVKLVLDRFHIVKALTEAVDDVRKSEWSNLNDKGEVSKGLRWLLYRHSSTRKKNETRILNDLEKSNRHIYRAWRLKDEFEQMWDYINRGSAVNFLKKWITTALKSRLEPMRRFALNARLYFDNIVNFVECHITNAVGEGVNRVIRQVNSRASGYRSFDSFADIVYLTVGDLNIPEQIPAKFRTL